MATITKLGFDNNAINNTGQIAANITTQNNILNHAFLYSNGKLTDLGTLTGHLGLSEAFGINDAGEVAGSSYIGGSPHAFLYDGKKLNDLSTLSGDNVSAAYAVNNSGQVVGSSGSRAFLYTSSQMYDINQLAGVSSGTTLSVALGINDSGLVVGVGSFPDGQHAFLFNSQSHALTELKGIVEGAPQNFTQRVLSINNAGQVVGEGPSTDPSNHGNSHAILYDSQSGAYTDLGTLTDPSSQKPYTYSEALGVNNLGSVGKVVFPLHPADLKCLCTKGSAAVRRAPPCFGINSPMTNGN